MAEGANGSVVLMSIRPKWATAIMEGRKRVEFRRAGFARAVSHVIVYATSPVKRVVGYFEVDDVIRAEPDTLWSRFADVGEIEREAFDRYYDGVADGVAIGIGDVHVLHEPLGLDDVMPSATPPQSFCYASPILVEDLAYLAVRVVGA